jgi:metal-sulfur cluster biosynthetic enzyme
MTDLLREVEETLDRVIDPCSAGIGRPAGLVTMGLVKSLDIDDASDGNGKVVRLMMRLTSPCCMMAPHFAKNAEALLLAIPGITAVEIDVSPAIDWQPDHMKASYREAIPRPHFMKAFGPMEPIG